jgi:hypothetical protein
MLKLKVGDIIEEQSTKDIFVVDKEPDASDCYTLLPIFLSGRHSWAGENNKYYFTADFESGPGGWQWEKLTP